MTESISNEKKRILGNLIHLEMKKLRMTKKQMIINKLGESVCSISTLYRIEKGIIIQDDEVYINLIAQLNRTYKENHKLDKAIDKINEQLMHYFETLEIKEANSILAEIKTLIKNENFYYQQIFTGYLDMLLVNLNQKKLTAEEYHYYQKMMEFMPEPYNVFLLHLCFCHAHNFIQHISEISKYEVYLKKHQSYLVIQIDSLLFLRCTRRIFEYQQVHLEVMEQIKQRKLINQEAKILGYYLGVVAEIQKNELNEVLDKLEQLLEINKLRMNLSIYNNVLSMVAMIYYADLKDYNKAYQLFENLLQEDATKIYIIGIYYFSSCELSCHTPLLKITKNIDLNKANVYLRYFHYKYIQKWSAGELINYLKSNIFSELKRNGNELKIRIFRSQCAILLAESSNKFYKDYYEFISKLE